MKVRWKGDEDLSVQEVQAHGMTFPRGKTVEVPDDHPKAAKFENHPQFEVVKGRAAPAEAAPEVAADAIGDTLP